MSSVSGITFLSSAKPSGNLILKDGLERVSLPLRKPFKDIIAFSAGTSSGWREKETAMLRRTLLISALASTLALAVPAHAATKTLKVGVTAGLHAEILRQALPIAKKNGLDIKVIEFQDYVSPNEALSHGDLDANIFQTLSYFELLNKQRNYGLAAVGKTITAPLTFYSADAL